MKTEWIVIDYSKYPNELVCKRCGARQQYPLGAMAIDIFVAIGNAFIKIHKDCKEGDNKNE